MEKNNQHSELLELLRKVLFSACRIRLSPKRDKHGLTFSQRHALFYMLNYPGIGLKELSGRLCITEPSMSNLADSLENRGYLRREKGATGKKKRKNIVLTEKGMSTALKLNEEPLKILKAVLSKTTDSERKQYYTVFSKFLERLKVLEKR